MTKSPFPGFCVVSWHCSQRAYTKKSVAVTHYVIRLSISTTNSGAYNTICNPTVCSDDLFDALQSCRRYDFNRPT